MVLGFGGGVGLSGCICGALSAAIIANGAKYGRKDFPFLAIPVLIFSADFFTQGASVDLSKIMYQIIVSTIIPSGNLAPAYLLWYGVRVLASIFCSVLNPMTA